MNQRKMSDGLLLHNINLMNIFALNAAAKVNNITNHILYLKHCISKNAIIEVHQLFQHKASITKLQHHLLKYCITD